MTPDEEAVETARIRAALDDRWPDGKRRPRLRRVMQARLENMQRLTGQDTMEALRLADRARYDRFLAGCRRAMIRDGLIECGHLGPDELRRLRERFETRGLHDFADHESEPEYLGAP